MKIKYFYILILISILVACNKSAHEEINTHAMHLYNDVKSLIKSYSDSLSNANDSATINNILSKYESDLTKISYKYPAETDYQLTIGQQDTISKLTDEFVRLKQLKLQSLYQPNDSITTDSTVLQESEKQ